MLGSQLRHQFPGGARLPGPERTGAIALLLCLPAHGVTRRGRESCNIGGHLVPEGSVLPADYLPENPGSQTSNSAH